MEEVLILISGLVTEATRETLLIEAETEVAIASIEIEVTAISTEVQDLLITTLDLADRLVLGDLRRAEAEVALALEVDPVRLPEAPEVLIDQVDLLRRVVQEVYAEGNL